MAIPIENPYWSVRITTIEGQLPELVYRTKGELQKTSDVKIFAPLYHPTREYSGSIEVQSITGLRPVSDMGELKNALGGRGVSLPEFTPPYIEAVLTDSQILIDELRTSKNRYTSILHHLFGKENIETGKIAVAGKPILGANQLRWYGQAFIMREGILLPETGMEIVSQTLAQERSNNPKHAYITQFESGGFAADAIIRFQNQLGYFAVSFDDYGIPSLLQIYQQWYELCGMKFNPDELNNPLTYKLDLLLPF